MRLEYDNLHKCEAVVTPGAPFFQQPDKFALKRYAYYVCFKCNRVSTTGACQCVRLWLHCWWLSGILWRRSSMSRAGNSFRWIWPEWVSVWWLLRCHQCTGTPSQTKKKSPDILTVSDIGRCALNMALTISNTSVATAALWLFFSALARLTSVLRVTMTSSVSLARISRSCLNVLLVLLASN